VEAGEVRTRRDRLGNAPDVEETVTISAVGMVAALVIFVIGLAVAMRFHDRRREVTIVATLVLALVVGWFSWLAGTSA
jgi:uncharacterized membrane protein YhaH (DUF805 family)